MPRPQYPSDIEHNDERRRIKPHFKIHHSIQNHPKTTAVFADNNLLAAYTRLGILASERGAAHTGDKITLSKFDLRRVTGINKTNIAEISLRCLADNLAWSVEHHGDIFVIHFRNFAEKQGITPRTPRSTPPNSGGLRVAPPPKIEDFTDINPLNPPLPGFEDTTPTEPIKPTAEELFENQIRETYPKRNGASDWKSAFAQIRAAIKSGEPPEQFFTGTKNYAAWCNHHGKTGTEYVKNPKSFFGREKHWREPWYVPKAESGNGNGNGTSPNAGNRPNGPNAGKPPNGPLAPSTVAVPRTAPGPRGPRVYVLGGLPDVEVGPTTRYRFCAPEEISGGAIHGYETPSGLLYLHPGGHWR